MEINDRKNYKQLNDEILISLAQQGENRAFDALLGRYRLHIKKYLLCLIADPDAVEDILQDAFLKVYKSIYQYRGDAGFKSWLFVIVRNTWKNHLRSQQYQSCIDRFQDVYALDVACEQSIENVVLQQQQSKLLQIAIENLPAKQRTTMSMRINRQLPFAHIAKVMHCSLSTAKSNHYYGARTVERMIAA